MIGRVISVKMKNTATVLVTGRVTHPLYKKTYARSKKYLVDDLLKTKPGDIVEIEKVAPISKRKHWRIVKVIGRDIEAIVEKELKEKAAADIEEVMPEEKTEELSVVSPQTGKKTDEKQKKPRKKKEKSES